MTTKSLIRTALASAAALLMWGCASIGTPGGGARDEDPPRLVRANPRYGSVNVPVTQRRIFLDFNEIVNVKDAFNKVVVSPLGLKVPRVTANGRRVTVEFEDTLHANTTYTVDFADAIEDNNEGNPLQGFFYSFSTGATLDSLEISGMVLGALDLEPQQGVLVGVYPDQGEGTDTCFFRRPFDRLARTDDRGRFTVPGLRGIPYRLFALKDLDADRKYANPEEDVAFWPVAIIPSAERMETVDTVLNLKTGAVDTIVSRMRTRFMPNDVLLRMFNTQRRPQYLAKYERRDSTAIYMQFNAPTERLPQLEFTALAGNTPNLILESSAGCDTLTYWLPRELTRIDSLQVKASFLRPDSTGNLVWGTDVLDFDRRRDRVAPKKVKKKKTDNEETKVPPPPELGMEISGGGLQEIYAPLRLQFPVPLARLDTAAFRLEQKKDTLWIPAPHTTTLTRNDSLSPRRFSIDYPWEFGTSYRLVADSASAEGLYGEILGKVEREFKTKAEEDYSSLALQIAGLETGETAVVELLDGSGNPMRRVPVVRGQALFKYLDPGTYYARLIEDLDGDGLFTTGEMADAVGPDGAAVMRLPEAGYYYPKKINVKKNWDVDQLWNPFETPVDLQKPESLKKNKPQARHGRQQQQTQEEDEEVFDPTVNPFDPKDAKRKKAQREGGTGRL